MAWRISPSSLRNAAIDCSIPVGAQRLDLARDLEQMAFERGKVRPGRGGRGRRGRRHGGRDRRRVARRDLPRWWRIEFVLARGDLRDRDVERGRAERRGGTIDLGGGAFDHLGLPRLVLLNLLRCPRVRDLRQPRVEAGDRVVELLGDALFAAGSGLAARNVGARSFAARFGCEICSIWRAMESSRWWISATSRLSWLGAAKRCSGGLRKSGGAEAPMVELSQSFSDRPARRAAASALSRTDGSMPSILHDTREFMLPSGSRLRRSTCAFSLPARPSRKTIGIHAGRLPQMPTFSRYGK